MIDREKLLAKLNPEERESLPQDLSIITYAEIHLGYYKQGCDLHSCLEESPSTKDGFLLLAKQMDNVAAHLREIAVIVARYPESEIEVEADTHHISITGPNAMIMTLVMEDLANLDLYVYEEEWEEIDEEEFDEDDQ